MGPTHNKSVFIVIIYAYPFFKEIKLKRILLLCINTIIIVFAAVL